MISLRPATIDDAERLYVWRIDPETQAASMTAMPADFAMHCEWLRANLNDPQSQIFVAKHKGRCVGTMRMDRHGDAWEASWTVAPHARRKGIGTSMVSEMARRWPARMFAYIKPTNEASIKIAERAGILWEKAE